MKRQMKCQLRGVTRVLLISAMIIVITFLFTPFAVRAQTSQTRVVFQPNDLVVSVNSNVEIAVWIQNVQDLYAYDLTLKYDPAYIEILDSDAGTAGIQVSQGTFLDEGLVLKNTVDPNAGTINLVTTQLNPSPEKSGNGNLLVIRMKGLKAGSTTLQMTNLLLSTRKGISISFSSSDANLSLSNSPQIGPTATPFQTNDSRPLMVDPLTETETVASTMITSEVTETVLATLQATELPMVEPDLVSTVGLEPTSPEVTVVVQPVPGINQWSYLFFGVMLVEGSIIAALFFTLFTRFKK